MSRLEQAQVGKDKRGGKAESTSIFSWHHPWTPDCVPFLPPQLEKGPSFLPFSCLYKSGSILTELRKRSFAH